MGEPRAVDRVRHAHRTDRALEGDAGDHESGRGTVDRQHVVGVDKVGPKDRGDDVHLVAEPFGKRRPQRPVDQPVRKDRLISRSSLAAEEGAWDLSRRVHALFDVDGKGEEIRSLAHLAGRGRRDKDDGLPEASENRPVGLAGKLASLKGHDAVGPAHGTRDGDGVSHDTPLFSRRQTWPVPSRRAPDLAERARAPAPAEIARPGARRLAAERCRRRGCRVGGFWPQP